MAGPANPDPVDITQPDGSIITTRLRGDEFQNWNELEETGHTIIRNHSTGFWEYAAQNSDGTLRGSGVTVKPRGQNAPVNIPKGLRPPRKKELEKQMNEMLKDVYRQRVSKTRSGISQDGPIIYAAPGDWLPPTPVSGTRKMLLILISFSDKAISTTPASWYTAVFDTTAKSVAKYYKENSFNTLNITPASHTQSGNPAGVVSVTLSTAHPNSYNLSDAALFTSDQTWGNGALQQAAPFVDFNSLDTNGDGNLDPSEVVIYFIAAGYEYSASSGSTPAVWAHAWRTSGTGLTAGTKNVQQWSQSGEYYNAAIQMPMGVVAHELGHQMGGLPDLYDTSNQNSGMGLFSLMAGGSWGGNTGEVFGTTPVALDAWSREYVGWTTPVTPTTGATVYLPGSLSASNAALKLILPATSTAEYFLAENRYPIGWDLGLKGWFGSSWAGGLLLTHIDITAGTSGSNDINNYTLNSTTPGHQGVVPVQASTTTCNMLTVGSKCYGHATTLFYQGNNSIWGPSTNPNSNYYAGATTAIELNTISLPASTMSAVLVMPLQNGTCGSSHNQAFSVAPSTNLCITGNPSTVNGNGRPWNWTCSGLNGGAVANCRAFSISQQVTLVTQNFDDVTTPALPAGWLSNGTLATWQTNSGTIHPSGIAAHTPSNLVYFNSRTASSGNTAYLSSPAFSLFGKEAGRANFWMYRDSDYSSSADLINVYVNTTSSLAGASLLGTVNRYIGFSPAVGSAGWYEYTFDIPVTYSGSTNYLLIDGVSAYGNDIHLDDITVVAFPAATVPGAPIIGTATPGNTRATVSFTAPVNDGGSAITGYTATSSPGNISATGTASPITVTGLANGTAYTFTVTATNSVGTGTASAASNGVTPVISAPDAPNGVTAIAGNTQATVSFTAPVNDGGSAITGYIATSSPGNITATGTASPITVTGLTNGAAYTFTVTATNAVGTGTASAASNSVTPATVPGVPTIGTATAGNGQATITFTSPGSDGGSAITGYTVTSHPGNITATGTASPITVTGLTNGTAYTFTVTATNAVGTGAASAASNSVTSYPDGDLTGDGTVDTGDALRALRIAAGIITPTTNDILRGDVAPLVNGVPQPDGNIDIGDVVVILRKAVGLVIW
jgi:M6 family metalloprotease-like protein